MPTVYLESERDRLLEKLAEIEDQRDAALARADRAEAERDEARRELALLGSQPPTPRMIHRHDILMARILANKRWPDSGQHLFPEELSE